MTLPLVGRIFRYVKQHFSEKDVDNMMVRLTPDTDTKGIVLLSYILEPFLLREDEPIPNTHTHYWESMQIAQTFLDMGYMVDIISYRNMSFRPKEDYKYFISARTNFEIMAKQLRGRCIKIAHLDTAHWIDNNHNAYIRLVNLKRRNKVSLSNLKTVEENRAIEEADLATVLGGAFTIETYAFAEKPIYRIPISSPSLYPWNEVKDFDKCRNNYMWFGSSGFVHKGLDLVLDVFKEMPDYKLAVLGPVEQEEEFVEAYYKELYETPNIETIGWVDVESPEFVEYARNTAALIYPTCAEGGGGSAITCMHAGMIPIVSYEASIDIPDCGILLKDCSIQEIKRTISAVSALPTDELGSMARRAWEYARKVHTRDNFAKAYHRFVTTTLEKLEPSIR